MHVPAPTRVSSAMYSRASVCIFLVRGSKLEDFIIHVLFRGEIAEELGDIAVLNVLSCTAIGSWRLFSQRAN